MSQEVLLLTDVARRLEIHPFELVRVLELQGGLPERLAFQEADLEPIAALAGLEHWWGRDVERPAEPGDRAAWARALAGRIRHHRLGGERCTRLDNLLRGLDPEQRATVRRLVADLLDAGWLEALHRATGTWVRVTDGHYARFSELADGGPLPAFLDPAAT